MSALIDAHLHLWQLSRGWYGWNTPALGPVHSDSTLADLASELSSSGVSAVALVQAADTLAETDWLLDVAEREQSVGGVVGYLPLDDPAELECLLHTYADRPLVGVRQLWHDHDRPAAELGSPDLIACLELLGNAGLAVDIPDAFPRLTPALPEVVASAPRTRFVLDHCAKPPFGDAAAWTAWEAAFTELAAQPNVIVKVSGLFGGSGSSQPATDHELTRVVELTRTVAGADRAMIGSDWPMVRGRLGYAASINRLLTLLAGWSPAERDAVLSTTATRVYGLSRPRHPCR